MILKLDIAGKSASEKIALVNDAIRKTLKTENVAKGVDTGGKFIEARVMLSANVAFFAKENPKEFRELLVKIADCDDFTTKNDPYGERDFGEADLDNKKYFWKFDSYDNDYEYFEENGNRVLTIMEASDY